jgi:hypothetical protein
LFSLKLQQITKLLTRKNFVLLKITPVISIDWPIRIRRTPLFTDSQVPQSVYISETGNTDQSIEMVVVLNLAFQLNVFIMRRGSTNLIEILVPCFNYNPEVKRFALEVNRQSRSEASEFLFHAAVYRSRASEFLFHAAVYRSEALSRSEASKFLFHATVYRSEALE